MSENKKIHIVHLGAILVILLAVFVCWAAFRPHALDSVKELTITVTDPEGNTTSSLFKTTETNLYEALRDHIYLESISDPQYGLVIYGVNGIYADPAENIAWTWTVNGASPDSAMDEYSISDGDVIAFFTFTW